MRAISFTSPTFAAADTNYIAESQTPLAAGDLTLTAAAAQLTSLTASPRYGLSITIDCAGADAARTFTITGTAPGGATQSVTAAGSNSSQTAVTLLWESVTSIAVDDATAGAVIVGIAQAGGTAWLPLDIYTPSPQTGISVNVTGTVNQSVQYTNEDPFDATLTPLAQAHPVAALTNLTADQTAQATAVMRAVRLLHNSGSGSSLVTIVQQSTL